MTNEPGIVDAHIHLWDKDRLYYSWLSDQYIADHVIGDYTALCEGNYLIDDYRSDVADCTVAAAVHIQCALGHRDPVEETAWLQEIANQSAFALRIVGTIDMAQGSALAQLDGHCRFAAFAGIRIFSEPDAWRSEPYAAVFDALSRRGLVFDLDADPDTMDEAGALADRHPDLTFVLGHAGFPKQRTPAYFERWSQAMTALAQRPNVMCKISGLGMVDHGWTQESIAPWVLTAMECFGVERSMFATNWPVDSLFSDYPSIVSAYRSILSGLSVDECNAFFSGNAYRVYGFDR